MNKKFGFINVDKDEIKVIIFTSMALLILLGVLEYYFGDYVLMKIILNISFTLLTGIFTGYLVSYSSEQKNKREGIKNDIEYILSSLGLLRDIIGNDVKETRNNFKDIILITNSWKSKLIKVKEYFVDNKYEEKDIVMINHIIEILKVIEKDSKKAENDFIEIKRFDILEIWLKLSKIRTKLD